MSEALSVPHAAGATRIETTARRMPVSRLGGPSSLPRFRWQQPIPDSETPADRGLSAEESAHSFKWGKDSILPYRVYDDYDRAQQPDDLSFLTLDNGRLRVSVAPQYGGRLMELRDLTLDRDLVFRNPVFQPANLASLNAWFSGGIEWNGLIPGHTPFTCAPVFAGIIETARGPVLRLYEFDRVVEATWQIDLFLPQDDDRLFVHGRIVNAAARDKLAYWWTNVAVQATQGMRVISPAAYSIQHVLPGNHLERFPFPDPARFDGSYPDRWRDATSVFFRKPSGERLFIAALDDRGIGLAQTATAAMRGRKFFYFGTAPGGRHWMDYLARPGEGDYIEIQSGIAPTQNQRFELPANGELHWTEVYGALAVDASSAHAQDYQSAVDATAEAVGRRFPEQELAGVDAFLTEVSRLPLDQRLAAGSVWGGRHEKLTGRGLATGLDFSVQPVKDCWDDLLATDAFSEESLAAVPLDFAVSDLWVEALERSRSLRRRNLAACAAAGHCRARPRRQSQGLAAFRQLDCAEADLARVSPAGAGCDRRRAENKRLSGCLESRRSADRAGSGVRRLPASRKQVLASPGFRRGLAEPGIGKRAHRARPRQIGGAAGRARRTRGLAQAALRHHPRGRGTARRAVDRPAEGAT